MIICFQDKWNVGCGCGGTMKCEKEWMLWRCQKEEKPKKKDDEMELRKDEDERDMPISKILQRKDEDERDMPISKILQRKFHRNQERKREGTEENAVEHVIA